MGNITFTFTNQGTGQTVTNSFSVSDANLGRLVTYLRYKYSSLEGIPPDPVVNTPASPGVALKKACQDVMNGWKNNVITWETQQEAANVANTIPPIDVTEN